MSDFLELINKKYSLKENDVGSFAAMKISGMKFLIRSFEAQGLGHVSVMKANGFFGLMQMESLIITPFEMDMPLFSTEFIKVAGNIKFLAEIYDTVNGECDLSTVKSIDISNNHFSQNKINSQWYDNLKLYILSLSCKKKYETEMRKKSDEIVEAYLSDSLSAAETEDMTSKKEKTLYYVDGLLNNGGPATDVFVKSIGKEKTADILHNVLFGTNR